jgi:two-component system, chemotaxis family, sensor kinase CheA
VQLEKDPQNRATLASVFRTIHTIKGTCGFLGFTKLEAMAHVGENLLSRLRDLELLLNPDITTALLRMLDAVRQMMQSTEAIGNEGERNDEELIKMLSRVQPGGSLEEGPAATRPAVASPAPPTPPAASSKHAKTAPTAADATVDKRDTPAPPPVAGSPLQADAAGGDGATNGKSKAKKNAKEAKIVLVEVEKIMHAEESEAPQAQQSGRGSVGDSSIRVDVVLLDKLMNLVGCVAPPAAERVESKSSASGTRMCWLEVRRVQRNPAVRTSGRVTRRVWCGHNSICCPFWCSPTSMSSLIVLLRMFGCA